jgi:formate dehydrogenase assembly factor FdhD
VPPLSRNPKLKSCEKACKREKENILKTSSCGVAGRAIFKMFESIWKTIMRSKRMVSATKMLTLDQKTGEKKES